MPFDPSTIDLSFVDPPHRAEVLHRIKVLEEFSQSRGPAARLKAREALGLGNQQLDLLTRAWTSRRRAEDITLRATRKSRPTPLSREILSLIAEVADAHPGGTVLDIAEEVRRRAIEVDLVPPAYPTVNRYVRERKAATRRETITAMGHDILVDVTVADIAVGVAAPGIRPHVVIVADGQAARLIGLSGTIGIVDAGDVANAFATAVDRDLTLLGGSAEEPEANGITIAMPYSLDPGWDRLSVALREAGAHLTLRELRVHTCGKVAAALFGTSVGGYKLRPRLVCRPEDARRAVDPKRKAVSMADATGYLMAVATENAEIVPSPFAKLGRHALMRLSRTLKQISAERENRHL